MEKRYIGLIIFVFVLIVLTAGYFLFCGGEDSYYNSYEMQVNATNKSMEQSQNAMGMIMLSMMGQNVTNSNITTYIIEANKSTNLAVVYSQDMLKNAKTESQKQYARMLLNQSNEMTKFVDLLNSMTASAHDSTKVKEIMQKLDGVKTQEESYQNQLDKIRAGDSELNKNLDTVEKKFSS